MAIEVSKSFSEFALLFFCRGGSLTPSSFFGIFLSVLIEAGGGIYSENSLRILLESSSSRISVLGSETMFFPAFTKDLFFSFSLDLFLEFDCREAGFCSQLSFILKSPFRKKFINYYATVKSLVKYD